MINFGNKHKSKVKVALKVFKPLFSKMSLEILVKFRKISLTALPPSHHHLAIQWVRRVNGTQLGQKHLGYFELELLPLKRF